MTPFLSFLSDKQLPGWALLHNARIAYHLRDGHTVSAYDDIHWSESIAELRSKITAPTLLNSKEAREMMHFRYSPEEIHTNSFKFDDLPSSLMSESSDWELFGESWVIFWVVPADKDWVVNYLLAKAEREAADQISAEQIKEIWDDYLHRIFFQHLGEEDVVRLTLLYDEVQEELMERMNASDKAPEESAWEILNEETLLGDDDDW